MNDALKQLEQQYFLLLNSLDDLLAKCSSDEQKTELKTAFVSARRNYWSAINATFHIDDPRVESAIEKLRFETSQLESQIRQLDKIAKVIGVASSAVAAGGSLLALAG